MIIGRYIDINFTLYAWSLGIGVCRLTNKGIGIGVGIGPLSLTVVSRDYQ